MDVCRDAGIEPSSVDMDATSLYAAYDWSPDGAAFVFRRFFDDEGLWVAEKTGESWSASRIATDGWSPRWSAAVDRILFVANSGDIDVMDPDGTDRDTVIEVPAATAVAELRGAFEEFCASRDLDGEMVAP